jgi:hypothetical protein
LPFYRFINSASLTSKANDGVLREELRQRQAVGGRLDGFKQSRSGCYGAVAILRWRAYGAVLRTAPSLVT